MLTPEEKIINYIHQAPAFAQPICLKLREIILQADPSIKETWKWSSPVYEKNGLICGIGAFKQHVNLSFFLGAYLNDPANILLGESSRDMRTIKFKDVSEINESILIGYIQEAAHLNKSTIDRSSKTVEVPTDLEQALQQNPIALAIFEKFAYTHRKEYVRWLEDAKKPETRQRRLQKAVEMIAAGKKYS
ncbi:MAG: YdeI/OmpD-associated family protein [Bacteroidota bacterium]|nr:YdeI/OmpD-associated family protein [Bacteroidota bacterium]